MASGWLAVVAARGGSRGVPRKHLLKLCGKPVLAHTLEFARRLPGVRSVILTSDDKKILDLGRRFGAIPVQRPPGLARPTSRLDQAVAHAVLEHEKTHPRLPYILMLYGNIPVRSRALTLKGMRMLERGGLDSVVGVSPIGRFHPLWCYRHEKGRLLPYQKSRIFRRQDLPKVYFHAGSIVLLRREALLAGARSDRPSAYLGRRNGIVEESLWDAIEIDEPDDLALARFLISRRR